MSSGTSGTVMSDADCWIAMSTVVQRQANAAELTALVHAHRMAQRGDAKGRAAWLKIAASMKVLRGAANQSKRVLASTIMVDKEKVRNRIRL